MDRFITWASVGIIALLFSGCSYGTYYATGSYASQDNSRRTSGCVKGDYHEENTNNTHNDATLR